jgi:hypothetical protein
MPITVTAVGTTLDVSIVDDNFESIQDLFRQGLIADDFVNTFDRFKIKRFTGGKLVAMDTGVNPLLISELANTNGVFDITYRHVDENSSTNAGDEVETRDRAAYAMELLGKPGPSMYYHWQEEGKGAPIFTLAGWPPSGWPFNRYPAELCFSKWLTVPFASARVWVDEPCIARIHATCKGSHNLFRIISGMFDSLADNAVANKRSYHFGRFGLVVDTNPNLYSDEFTNTNPNILDPVTGAQAPYVSWKIIKDRTFFLPQRAQIHLTAEVALKGRRYYNFSLKFRDAAHHGWCGIDGANNLFFEYANWETASGDPDGINPFIGPAVVWLNGPSFSANWTALMVNAAGNRVPRGLPFWPSWINLWENTSMNVEFFYGRDEAYSTNSAGAEFSTKPT